MAVTIKNGIISRASTTKTPRNLINGYGATDRRTALKCSLSLVFNHNPFAPKQTEAAE